MLQCTKALHCTAMAEGEFSLESVRVFMIENGGRVTNHQLVTHFKRFLSDPSRKGEYREKFKDFVNLLATIKEEEGEKYLVLKKRYRELGCVNLFPNQSPSSAYDFSNNPVARSDADTGSGPALSSNLPLERSVASSSSATATHNQPPAPTPRFAEKVKITAAVAADTTQTRNDNQNFGFYTNIAAGPAKSAGSSVAAGKAPTPSLSDGSSGSVTGLSLPVRPVSCEVTTLGSGGAQVPRDGKAGSCVSEGPGKGERGHDLHKENRNLALEGRMDAANDDAVQKAGDQIRETVTAGTSGNTVGSCAPWESDARSPLITGDIAGSAAGPTVGRGGRAALTARPAQVPSNGAASGGAAAAAQRSSMTPAASPVPTPEPDRLQHGHAGLEPPASEGRERKNTPAEQPSLAPPEEPKISVKERTRAINRMTSDTDVSSSTKSRKRESRLTSVAHDSEDADTAVGISNVTLEPEEREWMIVSSSADYQQMSKLLRKNPTLAKQKDFTCGYTALHWAAKHGKLDVVKLLLDHKVAVNARSHGGFTPLHLAVMHCRYAIAELLVKECGADKSIRDFSGKRPKQYLKRNAPGSLQELLQDTGKPNFFLPGNQDESGFSRTSSFNSKTKKSSMSFSSRVSKALSSSNENVKEQISPATTPTQSPRFGRKTTSFIFGFGKDSSSVAAHDASRDLMPPPAHAPAAGLLRGKRTSKAQANMSRAAVSSSATISDMKDYTDSTSCGMVRSGSAPEIAELDSGGSESSA